MDENTQQAAPKAEDQKLLEQIRKRFREAADAESEIRAEALEDLRYLAGDQWPADTKRRREAAKLPCLRFNRLPAFVGQVVNQARQNNPAIKISPVDDAADVDTADIIAGLFRHIEYDSKASIAYDTARQYAVACSFGYLRVLTQYCSDDSFDQEIKIEAVPDPFSVYLDPHAKKADRSDARWAIVVERIAKEIYQEQWPKSAVNSAGFDEKASEGWIDGETVQVAEYWYVTTTTKKLLHLSTGETVLEGDSEARGQLAEQGITVEREREVLERHIKQVTTNGVEILESHDWPGRWIPIIPVFGNELIVDRKRRLFSLIRFARDPQQLYNYLKTAQAETLMRAPKAPYIGAHGQFEGFEDDWGSANVINHSYLEYNPVDVAGKAIPPPQRNTWEAPIQALSASALQEADEIKATTGIYDASLGNRSNETSGIGIQRRQQQSDTANFHYEDNFARAQDQLGRIMLDLLPHIYDTERWARIIGEDQTQKVVKLNGQYKDEGGKDRHYRLDVGKYDVRVSTGPSFATRRQESFALLAEFGRAWPQLFQIAGDVLFRNSDIPGGDEVAERIKRTLPPELAGDDEKGPQQIPPQVKAQMQQAQQMIDQLTGRINEMTEEAQGKRVEMESRYAIAAMQAKVGLLKTLAQIGSAEGMELLRMEIGQLDRRDDLAREPTEEEQPLDQAA